jgi:PPP family 3-phenylpropionic acid transporter
MFLFQVINTPILQLLHGFLFMHEDSDRRFGQLRAYGSLGFVVVNILMGLFADRVMGGRLEFIFPAFGIVTMAGAGLLALLPDRHPPQGLRRPTFLEVQRHFLSQWQVSVFLVFVLLYQAGHSFSYTLQSVLMREMGADNTVIASSYSLAAIVELPVFFAANRLIRRFGELRLLAFAAATQAVRWVLVWQADSPGEVVLISLMHAVTFGIFYVCSVTYMNRHAGPHYKASAQALLALAYFGVAQLAGNILGGRVAGGGWLSSCVTQAAGAFGLPDRGSLRSLYLFSSGLAAAACVVALALHWRARRSQDTPVFPCNSPAD